MEILHTNALNRRKNVVDWLAGLGLSGFVREFKGFVREFQVDIREFQVDVREFQVDIRGLEGGF